MRNLCETIWSAQANDGSYNSSKIDGSQIFALSAIATYTDNTAAGTLKFQASNDQTNSGNIAADFTPTNWVDVTNGSVSVTTGGTVQVQINPVCYRWYRLVWTRSAGAGTFSVRINGQAA